VLLDILPGADEDVAPEIRAALAALGEGKTEPALLRALKDKDPARRAAAATALGKDGGAYLKRPGRRLYLRGVKHPMKTTTFSDGKKAMTFRVIAVEYFNGFEDKVFAKP